MSQGADPDEIGLMNIDEQLPVLEYPQPGLDIIKVPMGPLPPQLHLPSDSGFSGDSWVLMATAEGLQEVLASQEGEIDGSESLTQPESLSKDPGTIRYKRLMSVSGSLRGGEEITTRDWLLAEGLPVGKKASAPSSVKGAGVDMFE